MTYIIVGLISFICGMGAMFGINQATPPKTVIQNIVTTQNVETKNTSIQESSQAQITATVITGVTNYHYSINFKGSTNITLSYNSKTNKASKTNK